MKAILVMNSLILQKLRPIECKKKSDFPGFGEETLAELLAGKNLEIELSHYELVGLDSPVQVGTRFDFEWNGDIQCQGCEKFVKKVINGYCFACGQTLAEADSCVMSPEKCHYLAGTCRNPEWGRSFCYQPHIVYLAYTGGFKVGITRVSQVPIRWIDQGATWAMPICLVGSRHQAGAIERQVAEVLSDKTQWQRMLMSGNLQPKREEIRETLARVSGCLRLESGESLVRLRVSSPPRSPNAGRIEWLHHPGEIRISYDLPREYTKVNSIGFEKQRQIHGRVQGIKGQYLLFDEFAFNVRRHEGFRVQFQV